MPLEVAQRTVLEAVPLLPEVAVALVDALGLVLAGPVVAPHDLPPFANSAVDGYAVRAPDVAAPATLDVVEEIAAGSVAVAALGPGTAIKVMTGAPLPVGTEAVVRVEDTERDGDRVRILAATSPGTAMRPAGGDVAAGTTVLRTGERLGPAHLGVLASLGIARPVVFRRPRVAVMSTGDELEPPETKVLGPGMIRDANRFLLRGLLDELGATVVDLGIVADDVTALRTALAAAADTADVVVTSGGVSMGDHDVVKEELLRLGSVGFWRVAMQPAKPFGFGTVPGTSGPVPFFGLPGNPVSVVVAFEQYLRPALLQMMGAEALFRPRVDGVLEEGATTDPRKDVFLRVVATPDTSGSWTARSAGGQSSNVLSAMAAANAFAVVPRGVAEVPPGGTVTLEMFRHPSTRRREEADNDD